MTLVDYGYYSRNDARIRYLLMHAQSTLDETRANLHHSRLESFAAVILAKVTLQKRLEDG